MTHPVILNIGMLVNHEHGQIEMASTAVLRAMRAAGILWERWQVHESSTEQTMVVECYATDHQINLVATWLDQDCIAVWDQMHREGRLVGPRAAKWGAFDPSLFLLINGSIMSEARSAA